jgi:hypothetical protein
MHSMCRRVRFRLGLQEANARFSCRQPDRNVPPFSKERVHLGSFAYKYFISGGRLVPLLYLSGRQPRISVSFSQRFSCGALMLNTSQSNRSRVHHRIPGVLLRERQISFGPLNTLLSFRSLLRLIGGSCKES